MKTGLTFFLIVSFLSVFSQDNIKINQINALVTKINSSPFPIHTDTLVKDHPELGLKMKTYLSMVTNGQQLLKYVNYVSSTVLENGVTRHMNTSSSFYYDQNKLIKVEEYLEENGKKKTADWYYSDDKPLYYTLKSDKSADRATLLLAMSKTMLDQIIK